MVRVLTLCALLYCVKSVPPPRLCHMFQPSCPFGIGNGFQKLSKAEMLSMFMERRTLLKKVEEYVELEYNIENPKPSLSCALIQKHPTTPLKPYTVVKFVHRTPISSGEHVEVCRQLLLKDHSCYCLNSRM